MAYVYRHIRLDKNIPFYIGIGSDEGGEYLRANDNGNRGRNKYWNNIVSKTQYSVDILLDDISWELACKKEIEFIALYKRTKDGGTLANLTLGGEGQLGMTPWNIGMEASEETKKKQSIRKIGKPPPNKGKPMPKHQLANLIKTNTGRQPWNKGIPLREETKKILSDQRMGMPSNAKGIKWSLESRLKASMQRIGKPPPNKGKPMPSHFIVPNRINKPNKRAVLQYDLNLVLIAEYFSLGEAARQMNCTKQTIFWAVKSVTRTAKGFKWAYKQ